MSEEPTTVSLLHRSRGLMVGIAVGDALGRPVEGHREVDPSYIDEITTRRPRFLPYTDDAAMSIWLTESLLACGGFDGADMARRFADGYFAEPHRGYGRNIVEVFTRVSHGMDWRTAAGIQFEGSGSYGNGGAMRVAPVAVWAYPDLDETVHLARETARVTHTHPAGVEGAVVQAVAAHHALGDGFSVEGLLADLDRLVETDEFRSKLEVLGRALERDDDDYTRLHLGNWVAAHNSVLTAVNCFLLSEDFAESIIRAIRLGGDTDTVAAMAGALAGARFGIDSVPAGWRGIEGYERMIELADLMYAERMSPEVDGQ